MNGVISEGTRLEGFIEIEKVNTKDNVRTVYKNTITNGGKQLFLAKSAGLMLGISADTFGEVVCSNTLTKIGDNNSNGIAARQSRKDRDITNTLLNLPDEVLNNLSASSTFINIWNDDYTDADKLIGYCNNELNPTNNGKEGTIDYCLGQYMVDPYTVCKRWKYPEGIASGTVNCIAMMPAGVLESPYGDGVKFSKCIDKVNTQYVNYVKMSTGFMIPGVPGYTSNNEILLNFSRDGISRWKYNIGTGEITEVPETENFYVFEFDNNLIFDIKYIDGYLYMLKYSTSGISSGYYVQVYVYDPANSMAEKTHFNLAYKSGYEQPIKANIFKYNNNLYVSSCDSRNEPTREKNKLWKLTVGAGGYATGVESTYTDFSSLFELPSGLDKNNVGIGQYGDNYVLFMPVKLKNTLDDTLVSDGITGYKTIGYVCSDLSNPFKSIIDVIPGITPTEILFANASVKGTLRVGFDKHNSNGSYNGYSYDNAQAKKIVMNNLSKSNTNSITTNTQTNGVYLTLDKWWTSVISFVKLNTAIEVTDSDIIYISYGYKIVV